MSGRYEPVRYTPDGKRGSIGRHAAKAAAMRRSDIEQVDNLLDARSLARALKLRYGAGSLRKQADGTYLVGVPE